jgi:hypothetical protein
MNGLAASMKRRRGLIAGLVAGAVVCAGTPSVAMALPAGPVSTPPAPGTPELTPSTSPTEQVRQLVQCGTTMYAVGSFNTITQNGTNYARTNVFSFSAVSPYTLNAWAPSVNGVVNSIGFNGSNCADAYIGGKFTVVNGTTVRNIAEIDTTTGNVVTTFAHSASGEIQTVLGVAGHVLVGGAYSSINSSTADPYMTSLNPTTGHDDGFLHLSISGNYQFPGVHSNGTKVYNQSLSPDGRYDLVMGDFTSVGGLPRQQIFMLDVSGSTASVTGWTSPEWDGSQGEKTSSGGTGYPYECAGVEPFYIQAASWSPDESTIYIATTGYHPNGWPTGNTPRTGLCDVAAAFPATINPAPQPGGAPGYVLHKWINYAGCDSLYSTAADTNAAYFGGHERWSENPNACDSAGPGAIHAPGMEGLSPADGSLLLNSRRGPLYSKSRGLGADDMLITSAGLWIASDNDLGSQTCDGVTGHAGICFLPYP